MRGTEWCQGHRWGLDYETCGDQKKKSRFKVNYRDRQDQKHCEAGCEVEEEDAVQGDSGVCLERLMDPQCQLAGWGRLAWVDDGRSPVEKAEGGQVCKGQRADIRSLVWDVLSWTGL